MQIQLSNIGKRYNRDWIFRHCDYTFHAGKSYAIIGPNGSGKSTLLQTIAGAINPSEGQVFFSVNGQRLAVDDAYKYISLAAPYLEVIEEMTATEFLSFHAAFKPLLPSITITEMIAVIGLEQNADKQIRYYSSGMKQRIKLAQAIFSDTPILLLDEPCTNLDTTGYQLYQQLITTYCSNKLIIVSSNDQQEYGFCQEQILIGDYK
ncbi:MAG: ABC transporter ATP-binding protein [Pedobacter sp.]|nr:ABC transporter ATP-binding protein [Chitinophagaceae bacterium]